MSRPPQIPNRNLKSNNKVAAAQVQAKVMELLKQGFAFHQQGHLVEAKQLYEQALAKSPANFDAMYLLGLLAFQSNNLERAVALMKQAIAINPNHATAHFILGNTLLAQERFDEAVVNYECATRIKPDYADAYCNLGVSLQKLKRLEESIVSCNRAIELLPDYAEAYFNRGNSLQDLDCLEDALKSYDYAIKLKPDYAKAYYNRGIALQGLMKFEEAIYSCGRAIELKPDYAEAYNRSSILYQQLKNFDKALDACENAIKIKPDYAEAYYNRGNILQSLNKVDEAVFCYELAIQLKCEFAELYSNRGVALERLNRAEEALMSCDRAIELNPNYADAYSNRGVALGKLNRAEEAILSYERAIELKPNYSEAHYNLGVAFHNLQRTDEAVTSYDRAIELEPEYADAHWNKSLVLLLAGDFRKGWTLYEWRWRKKSNLSAGKFKQSLWLGDKNIKGKTILLHAEQGLGDTIQFCRYARLVKDLGAKVLLEVPQALMALLEGLSGVDEFIALGQELPNFDLHCPLMSLPLAFQTDLSNIPYSQKYLFAKPSKVAVWQKEFVEISKLKVGLVWNGGFRADQPELWATNERRNIPLDMFMDVFKELDVFFVSLQKGNPAEAEIKSKGKHFWSEGNFLNPADDIYDFTDTAAIIENLDLVISVDTSTAHLAAAMGKPTWILNRFDSCWRWLLNREDSPWYESVRLYRQDETRAWRPVLDKVRADLEDLLNKKNSTADV